MWCVVTVVGMAVVMVTVMVGFALSVVVMVVLRCMFYGCVEVMRTFVFVVMVMVVVGFVVRFLVVGMVIAWLRL